MLLVQLIEALRRPGERVGPLLLLLELPLCYVARLACIIAHFGLVPDGCGNSVTMLHRIPRSVWRHAHFERTNETITVTSPDAQLV